MLPRYPLVMIFEVNYASCSRSVSRLLWRRFLSLESGSSTLLNLFSDSRWLRPALNCFRSDLLELLLNELPLDLRSSLCSWISVCTTWLLTTSRFLTSPSPTWPFYPKLSAGKLRLSTSLVLYYSVPTYPRFDCIWLRRDWVLCTSNGMPAFVTSYSREFTN